MPLHPSTGQFSRYSAEDKEIRTGRSLTKNFYDSLGLQLNFNVNVVCLVPLQQREDEEKGF